MLPIVPVPSPLRDPCRSPGGHGGAQHTPTARNLEQKAPFTQSHGPEHHPWTGSSQVVTSSTELVNVAPWVTDRHGDVTRPAAGPGLSDRPALLPRHSSQAESPAGVPTGVPHLHPSPNPWHVRAPESKPPPSPWMTQEQPVSFAVTKAKCPSYVGATGILLQETKHVFKIITKEDRLKGTRCPRAPCGLGPCAS